jgi:hypothetical protein
MITRFFKKKPKAAEPKKTASQRAKPASCHKNPSECKKILTSEGWKRMMMRRSSGKSKK